MPQTSGEWGSAVTFPPIFNPKATRAVSHIFDMPVDMGVVLGHPDQLRDKLIAESQRLQRLLPEPPKGQYWELSIEQGYDQNDMLRNLVHYRAIYRLKDIR